MSLALEDMAHLKARCDKAKKPGKVHGNIAFG
jgi:hypothetical protein